MAIPRIDKVLDATVLQAPNDGLEPHHIVEVVAIDDVNQGVSNLAESRNPFVEVVEQGPDCCVLVLEAAPDGLADLPQTDHLEDVIVEVQTFIAGEVNDVMATGTDPRGISLLIQDSLTLRLEACSDPTKSREVPADGSVGILRSHVTEPTTNA